MSGDKPETPTSSGAEPPPRSTGAGETPAPGKAEDKTAKADDKVESSASSAAGSTAAKPAAAPPSAKSPARGKKGGAGRGALLVALLALLVGVAALGASAWMYRQQYLLPQAPDPVMAALQTEFAQLEKQQNRLLGSLESQRESLSQLRADQQQSLSQLLSRSQELTARVDKLATVDRKDWLVAEAEYLLRLANQRLQLGRDAKAAGQLLASADRVLEEMDDAGLHNVRAEIARELAALQGVAQFDTEGVYLRLEGLADAFNRLSLFDAPRYEAEPVPPADSNWQDRLASGFRRAWEKLRSYIRIRHREENFQPVLAPEQEAALGYSLQLMIEQAQMALLAERPALYRRSLGQARDWLTKYYQLDDRLQGILQQLDELMAVPMDRQMPDISGSLAALKTFIDSRRWQQEVGG